MPEAWCSPSMFCVMTRDDLAAADQLGDRAVAAIGPGGAEDRVALEAPPPRLAPRRLGGEKVVESIGAWRVHIPPGLRKSGMPDSVLIPAPVKTTPRRAAAMRRASAARSASVGVMARSASTRLASPMLPAVLATAARQISPRAGGSQTANRVT